MTGNDSNSQLLSNRLSRFLYNKLDWIDLNPIQKNALPIIKERNDTLVIAPTASGKTEAVLLPIFDDIITNNLEPLSVIYVSPLKALINDMNERIEKWCDYFNLEVTKWHGDVTPTKKHAFLKNPTDFLLITPESLEVIFMNKSFDEKTRIFKNVKYIIVDEIHYFVESDRGTQLNSLLNRIRHFSQHPFTTVGLSATVGNPELVSKWLNPEKPAEIVEDPSKRDFQYKVLCGSEINICKVLSKYRNKKILIFVHSRKDAERYYHILKRTLKLKNIYVHHSSIDKERREENEEKFKDFDDGFMISTSTLELGIDIGNIDIVVQIHPPHNVSSFLQRIGRSRRKQGYDPRTIIFYDNEKFTYADILISLAEISLTKKGHIENIEIPEKPKDIYFHQILSTIFENGRIKQKDLFNNLKDSFVFSKMDKDDFKAVIETMEDKGFVDYRDGYLSLGYNFEKKYGKRNFLDFYTVFCPNYEFKVKEGVKNIGGLDSAFVILFLKQGESFILGGLPWKVTEIDHKRFVVKVKKDEQKKGDVPNWISEGGVLDYLITRKIYQILLGEYDKEILQYFDNYAQKTVSELVESARGAGFKKGIIPVEFSSKEHKVYIYTFAGMKANALLSTIFSLYYDIHSIKDTAYYSSFKYNGQLNFENIITTTNSIESIFKDPEIYNLIHEKTGKFIKNKFIYQLPYEDQAMLKMEILYDKEGLLRVLDENSLVLIDSAAFMRSI
ncbi:MAG: DEAD/DEAH box helicase [Spirochaetales bacterium]|jgi:ATP-dependent Lhr-like helicase|nr:DEAD/DEAH box helicase [Spirochaetales bacterium]